MHTMHKDVMCDHNNIKGGWTYTRAGLKTTLEVRLVSIQTR